MQKFSAHLPLILKPDGNGKLSKRDGDRLGFQFFLLSGEIQPQVILVLDIEKRISSQASFTNMLVLLGWNPGTQ